MMVPSCETKMDLDPVSSSVASISPRKERNFPSLDLSDTTTLDTSNQPILVIQSPKTPTLSRKLKAVSLDSEPPKPQNTLEVARDVSSMPNTPKKQVKPRHSLDFEDNGHRPLLGPSLGSNLKRFASNTSISGSQTLKTLPEVMTLQDFSDSKPEPVRIKAKGLLERRGSNASLTIDLGSNSSISEGKPTVAARFNTTKSASHLNLTTFSSEKCSCTSRQCDVQSGARRGVNRHQAHTEACSMYDSGPTRSGSCRNRCYTFHKKCNCLCNFKCRRKSLSNENLYVPPCSFCTSRLPKDCRGSRTCKGCRRAVYPRQPDLDPTRLLSEDFKLHLQNIQYLQTAGSILSIADLKAACEPHRVPKLHQEFWEVPLNLQEKCLVSGSQSKNRYKGVLPNEHSRVHLPGPQSYIHANYIKGPDYSETTYIATQGPMEHTCEDFWEMVWSTECNCIVMLTGLIEKGKSKCELYFPLGKSNLMGKSYFYVGTTKPQDKFTFDTKNTQKLEEEILAFEEQNDLQFGSYKITFCTKENLGECVIRELELQKLGTEGLRRVRHYWFSNWQDHKMANPEQVLRIALHVLEVIEASACKNTDNNSFSSSDHRNKTNERDNLSFKSKLGINEISITNRPSSAEVKSDRKAVQGKTGKYTTQMHRKVENKNLSVNRHIIVLGNVPKEPLESSITSQICDKSPKSPRRIKLHPDLKRTPVIVHCSAGIGRTGCFLAILNGIQQLKSNFNVDVLAILCSLRLNRGGMVQTAEQYELIHRVLSLYTDLV